MKQCPLCQSTYTDTTLKFCLIDGTRLIPVIDEQETVVRHRPISLGNKTPSSTRLVWDELCEVEEFLQNGYFEFMNRQVYLDPENLTFFRRATKILERER